MSSQESKPLSPADNTGQLTEKVGTFGALRNRDYRWFWAGTLATFLGMQMYWPAQSWLAYQLTHSPLKLGLVSAAFGLPMLLISPFSGVIIDRLPKRNVLVISQLVNSVFVLVIAILISMDLIRYWHILVFGLFSGVAATFTIPSRQAIIPEVVPKKLVFNAVALYSAGMNLTSIAGPALAGALISIIGVDGVYYCALGFFAIAVISMARLPKVVVSQASGRSAISELVEGFRYLKNHAILLSLMLMAFVNALLGMPFSNLMPVFAEELHVQAQGYGLLLTMVGIGAVCGSLMVASLGNFKKKGRLLLVAGVALGLLLILFANSPSLANATRLGNNVFYVAAGILVLVGAASTSYSATNTTIIMTNIKDEFRGRTMSLYSVVVGLAPIGTLLAGAIAEARGVSFTVTLCGGIMALFMLVMIFVNRRIREIE